jgi:23S rRNA (pseudouridine1915-N3)-methyltransferase
VLDYPQGHVAELVYAYVSEAYGETHGSSSLPVPTQYAKHKIMKLLFLFAGGKYDAEILPLAESFVVRVARHVDAEVSLLPEKKDADDESILKRIHADDMVVLFDERGKMRSSEDFAVLFENAKQNSTKRIVLIVGGAHGVGDLIRARANHTVALSPMIFPHQLARVIALEQTYRALSILAGSKYHHG